MVDSCVVDDWEGVVLTCWVEPGAEASGVLRLKGPRVVVPGVMCGGGDGVL